MQTTYRSGEGPRSSAPAGPERAAARDRHGESRPRPVTAGTGRRYGPTRRRTKTPMPCLASAAGLAISLVLSGCGGGESGPGISGAVPSPNTVTYHQVSGSLPPGAYAYSGALRDAVRIGIEDKPVDFTEPFFHGRVQLEGAALAYWRPLASHAAQRAFDSCSEADPCRVFRVNSGGDEARLQDLARTVLEHAGLPAAVDRWFLHDRSRGGAGWYELPSREDINHGTTVASVALGRRFHPFPAPSSVIVPMAFNFDEQLEVQHYLSDYVAGIRSDPRILAELDRRQSAVIRRQHEATDIINASYGSSVDLNSLDGRRFLGVWRDDLDLLRDRSPLTWAEFEQSATPEADRTIRVWAAGNHDPGSGRPAAGSEGSWYEEFPNVLADDGYRNLDSLGPYYFEELRGEHIRVTALSTDEERLASYADPCGELPGDWGTAVAEQFGRHYCLAAPGTLRSGGQGTSFAAPFVSGVLARMKSRFPGVTPRELVRKLMDTADGLGEDGFDGGIYVVRVELDGSGGPVDRIVTVEPDGSFEKTGLRIAVADPNLPAPAEGEFRVVQRGCRPGVDYLVWTGNPVETCVVWRSPDPSAAADAFNESDDTRPYAREALARAEERFAYVYGAGRVDVDADDGVFAPMGALTLAPPDGPPAPVAATRLRTPAAWGAVGDRVDGLSLAAFDSLDFPFLHRLGDFVADGAPGGASPIPEFLPEPAEDRACSSLHRLAPNLLCSPWASEAPVHPLISPDGAGAALRLGEGARVMGFTREAGRLDGAASGAFSFDGGSSLAALHLDRGWTPGDSGRWRVDGSLTLAADVPRGLGAAAPTIFEAGTSLLSQWSVGLTRASGGGRTRVALTQPPRAEAGDGRFRVPSGRREDGTRRYETHRVSLVPSRRELTWRIAHQRPVLGGDLVLSVHRTENPGHRPAPPEHGAGLAYRARW